MISNLQDSNGFTPLHIAASNGNEQVILALLSHGADQAIRDPSGRISLHICCSFGYRPCVALLLGKKLEDYSYSSDQIKTNSF